LDEKNLVVLPKRMTNNNEDTSCRRRLGARVDRISGPEVFNVSPPPPPNPSEPAPTSVPGRMDGWMVCGQETVFGWVLVCLANCGGDLSCFLVITYLPT